MALYALSAVYFAGVMVRLMLTLTPVVCMLSGIAFSGVLEIFLRENKVDERSPSSSTEGEDATQSSTNKNLYDKVIEFDLNCVVTFEIITVTKNQLQAGKLRRMRHEQDGVTVASPATTNANEGIGVNFQTAVVMVCLILLMLFAVHCTWVTANAYSSPSIVLAFYTNDG